jgi:hypothetical protein
MSMSNWSQYNFDDDLDLHSSDNLEDSYISDCCETRNFFQRNGFRFSQENNPDRNPILKFSHHEITAQVQDNLNSKLVIFKQMITKLDLNDFDQIKILQNFDWESHNQVLDYFTEINDLNKLRSDTDIKVINQVLAKLNEIKPIKKDPSRFYTYNNLFYLLDELTRTYYTTTWMPCTWCTNGQVEPGTNKSYTGTLYCGCQSDGDGHDNQW